MTNIRHACMHYALIIRHLLNKGLKVAGYVYMSSSIPYMIILNDSSLPWCRWGCQVLTKRYNLSEQQSRDPGGHWWMGICPALCNWPNCLLPTFLYWWIGRTLGNWFFPNRTRLPSFRTQWNFYRDRGQMSVNMHRRRGGVNGIYHCVIPDAMNVTQTVYIGVYTANTGEW